MSIFNFCFAAASLCQLSALSAFVIFLLRKCLPNRLIYLSTYYFMLIAIIVVFWALGGGSVINDAYKRLHIFEELENNNKLLDAKNNPTNYDSMLQIDLRQFENSKEFKDYIRIFYEKDVDRAEAISVGLFFVLIIEFSGCCALYRKFALLLTKIPSTSHMP